MAKRFVIKDECTKDGKPYDTYYRGADGYIKDDPHFCEGYKRRGNAQRQINKDVNFSLGGMYKKVNDSEYIEGGRWHHHLSIIEIEQ